ncbi:ADP compounds hydrolase NudE [Lacimicrobium alkaliphilum]|uniref:ADP compounds hydrolase NudE n=1 Tax=Lacimicrobium alkaliphilum TaxID=1526571 RepID=A0ABQ1RRD7_9ALTE|nr:ADP compounds hydrolase NudE [Lacimicrobium alkaliphilum]GGD77001.1 ADP compounds hydrolase NudE [Lacimicrobium alkaliphilum]
MSKVVTDKVLPRIHDATVVAESRLFHIEKLDLEFSNGARREFERMRGSGRGAVMLVPFLDADTLLLVREYAAGTHSYQLGFPKGLIDPGEDALQAGNRELMEEVGYGAHKLHPLHKVSMAPAFFNASMDILIAEDLYPQRLPGDEPEPLDVVPWNVTNLDSLLQRPDFTEARSISALLLVERWLRNNR